jgi:hypothetical protein
MRIYLKTDLAYMAGFLDGEGCLYLGHRKAGRRRQCFPCTITISQTEDKTLRWMQGFFGGKVYPVKSSGNGDKQVWTWSIYGTEGDTFLRLVLPYLRLKKPQAEIYLKMRRYINANSMGKRLLPAELQERIKLVVSMKQLKKEN